MILHGARYALDARRTVRRESVALESGRFSFATHLRDDISLDLSGYLVLPGLINAHDHLEFNLFPKLGGGVYTNALDWARDVYQPNHEPVKRHSSLDKRARLVWGSLKNLLSGVTTVAHHNPYDDVFNDTFPVRVVRRYGWAHSLDFSPDIAERYQATPPNWPFIVHAAEGTDWRARQEIQRLADLGLLSTRTVLVHAVGASREDWTLMAARGTSVIWCPTSNLEMFDATISNYAHTSGVTIALGTDSAISAQTNLGEEIAIARNVQNIPLETLYAMVTTNPARMLRLDDGEGELRGGGAANFTVVKDYGQSPAETLIDFWPEAVVVRGKIRLMSSGFFKKVPIQGFHPLHVGSNTWFVDVDLPNLFRETVGAIGSDIRLVGRSVSA